MTSPGKTHCHIEEEGCGIIQGHDLFLSLLVLSSRQTDGSLVKPPNWWQSCQAAKLTAGESSGKTHCPIEWEGCGIIQGRDIFLSCRAAKLVTVIRENPFQHRRPEINLYDIEG
uniref:Uncharacterized protein n=1 Tax=Timema poppense TaxID=170557 RepID=A0A7R9D9Z8_TIMPO|nr:unnamed protein product [Timema poppensis]